MSTETNKTQQPENNTHSIRAYVDTSRINGRRNLTKKASLKPTRSLHRVRSLRPKALLNSSVEIETEKEN